MFSPHPVAPAGRTATPELTLPPPPSARRRASIPWLASLAPIAGAVVLWQVTGSTTILWFAALGPLIAVAAAVDGARASRRERREADRDRRAAAERVGREIDRRHDDERRAAEHAVPTLARYLDEPEEIWRAFPGREGMVVVGRGDIASAVSVGGGDDDAVTALRERARVLRDAPIAVPLAAGVAVCGPRAIAAAVARALILNAACAHPPGVMRVVPGEGDDVARELPHGVAAGFSCHLDEGAAATRGPADGAVLVVEPSSPIPPQCRAVLTIEDAAHGRLDYAGRSVSVALEAVGREQAAQIGAALGERHRALPGSAALPTALGVADLGAPSTTEGLTVTLGRDAAGPVLVDLVGDGPHALVAGMTGAGKSELLVTWIAQLASARSTRDVTFLLADFKGGTAFDALADLPHVAGVLTDLDAGGAQRALESLRAEIRHRERILADAGARDIGDPRVDLPRLVIVVDEFAALLDAHRELGALFADVAARGRGLGMHLILGTQRAAGVVRDALLANCPLRISLRVVDQADSRFVIGSDAAAEIPGDAASRGVALVRRAGDAVAQPVRIARTRAEDLELLHQRRAAEPAPRRPWQPPLPAMLPLAEVAAAAERPVIGLADQPDRQRRRALRLERDDAGLLVVGGPGSGKTTALAAIAAQSPRARWLPASAESLWDELQRLGDGAGDEIVLLDDLDAALAAYPPDYAAAALALVERACRAARADGRRLAVSTARLVGPVARVADLLPRRVLLRTASKLDHIAAGGDPSLFDAAAPAGRGALGGLLIQVPFVPPPVRRGEVDEPAVWTATAPLVGIVIRDGAESRRAQAALSAAGYEIVPIHEWDRARPAARAAVVAEPELWQRSWGVLQAVRARGDLLVDADCALEYRLLTGDRALPPFCAPGRSRAWVIADGRRPERMRLPGAATARVQRIA